jgi:hypothetical protein
VAVTHGAFLSIINPVAVSGTPGSRLRPQPCFHRG